MDKAKLVEILKQNGLEIAEDAAVLTIKGIFKALPQIVQETENKYDDLLIPLLAVIEPVLMTLVDKIDGEVG